MIRLIFSQMSQACNIILVKAKVLIPKPVPKAVKLEARRAMAGARRDGLVKPGPCVICGNERFHMHHPDYTKPLLVVPLCPRHHINTHLCNLDAVEIAKILEHFGAKRPSFRLRFSLGRLRDRVCLARGRISHLQGLGACASGQTIRFVSGRNRRSSILGCPLSVDDDIPNGFIKLHSNNGGGIWIDDQEMPIFDAVPSDSILASGHPVLEKSVGGDDPYPTPVEDKVFLKVFESKWDNGMDRSREMVHLYYQTRGDGRFDSSLRGFCEMFGWEHCETSVDLGGMATDQFFHAPDISAAPRVLDRIRYRFPAVRSEILAASPNVREDGPTGLNPC